MLYHEMASEAGQHTISAVNAVTCPCCSVSMLVTGGTEELVKGDWPELRILDLRWGGLAMLPCIQ